MPIMKITIKITILALAATAFAAIAFHVGLENAARESLRRREPFQTTVTGIPVSVEYASTRQVNVAVARGLGMRSVKKDWNKANIAGQYLGDRTRETAGGFIRGLFSNRKHEP